MDDENENRGAEMKTFTVQVGRKMFAIKNAAEGRALINKGRGLWRASRLPSGFGQVIDTKGRLVARFSMNGRLWAPGEFPTPELDEIPGAK